MEAFSLPADLEKYAGAGLPNPAKMMTAKGLAPLKPRDLVTCVYVMSLDPDPTIAKTSLTTLAGFPENILKTAIDGDLAPQVMDTLVHATKLEPIIEAIALHPQVHDETLIYLAERGSTRVIDIIANNQSRLLKCPTLLDALGKNPLTGAATIDRLLTFLQMEGIISPTTDADAPEVSVDEFTATLENFELPDDFTFPQELADDLQEIPADEAKGMYAKICKMTVMEKIKLAIRGNKEARTILIRDPNKLVSTAVIKSPKVTENEVIAFTLSRTVGDNVLRLINQNKDWTRVYRIKLGLASNPKTPFDIALSMLKMLRENDIANLAKSKAVPSAIATTAKRMVQAKAK